MPEHGCEVWTADLTDFASHQQALAAVLTAEERAHVSSLADGAMATLSRAVLRLLLARRLELRLDEVEVDRTCPGCGRAHGRPRLGGRAGGPAGSLHFSVSHGGDLLALAFHTEGPVGIDVEPRTAAAAGEPEPDLVDFVLTAAERQQLESAPAVERGPLFLHYWTGKEAVLKAVGLGLELPLHAVTLPPPPGPARSTVAVPGTAPLSLRVQYLDVGAGYVGALATEDDAAVRWRGRLSPAALPGQASASSSASTSSP